MTKRKKRETKEIGDKDIKGREGVKKANLV